MTADNLPDKKTVTEFVPVESSSGLSVELFPDQARASDATEIANTIADAFITGKGGVFEHGTDTTHFAKVKPKPFRP